MIKGMLIDAALLIITWMLAINGFSFSIVRPVKVASPANPESLQASVFVKLSAKEFGTITGEKLNLSQRIYFKIIQRRLKSELKENPDLLITKYYDPAKAKFKFDALWFVVAAFIGPLGILLAYTSHSRKGGPTKKNRITSAWLGFVLFVIWFGSAFLF